MDNRICENGEIKDNFSVCAIGKKSQNENKMEMVKNYCFAFKYSDIGVKGDLHKITYDLKLNTFQGIYFSDYSHEDFYESIPRENDKENDIFVIRFGADNFYYFTPTTYCLADISLNLEHQEKLEEKIYKEYDVSFGGFTELKHFYKNYIEEIAKQKLDREYYESGNREIEFERMGK
jgi:hypothetical protein